LLKAQCRLNLAKINQINSKKKEMCERERNTSECKLALNLCDEFALLQIRRLSGDHEVSGT